MTKNILLEINIKIDNVTEIYGEKESVSIVTFGGDSYSQLFTGKILPGAVDTQIHYNDKPTVFSARYVLDGLDHENNRCKIFIENNGSENAGSIITKPFIVTDSNTLKWMETADLSGRVFSENGNIIVRIYGGKENDN